MNWNEAIASIDPNQEPGDNYTSPVWEAQIDVFTKLLDLRYVGWSAEFSKRMTKHWVASWICTTDRVGLAVYCLDGKPVAVSSQTARKSDENIFFLSKEAAQTVRQLILSLIGEEDNAPPILNPNEHLSAQWWANAVGEWSYRR